MQKLVRLFDPSSAVIEQFNRKELVDGWRVISMVSVESKLILLLEKETRKEKLEHLDDL